MSDRLTDEQLDAIKQRCLLASCDITNQAATDVLALLAEVKALRAERNRLRDALKDIVIRCEEGDWRTDWLPTIAYIAREALLDGEPEGDDT